MLAQTHCANYGLAGGRVGPFLASLNSLVTLFTRLQVAEKEWMADLAFWC